MILEGQFVRLRPITVDDAEATFEWRHGKRARFLQAGAATVEQQRAWIASRLALQEHNWIIEYRGTAVGMCALHDINHTHHSAILGRLVIGEQELVGAAPVFFESELLLCDFAFRQLQIHKLYGGILDGHVTMLRTRLYLGYHQDGILRDHLFIDGQYRNWIAVSLLDHEYEATCRPRLTRMIEVYAAGTRRRESTSR